MLAKDDRVGLMSEIVPDIKSVKASALESVFAARIGGHRNEELRYNIKKVCMGLHGLLKVLGISQILGRRLRLPVGHYARPYLHRHLQRLRGPGQRPDSGQGVYGRSSLRHADRASQRISMVKQAKWPARMTSITPPFRVLNGCVEALVSIRRISSFLSLPKFRREGYFSPVEEVANVEDAIDADVALSNAGFSAKGANDVEFRLRGLDLTVRKGDLIGVVGAVGSGKSLLLKALLGELDRCGGAVAVREASEGIGYASQEPWLQAGSVRDNILWGKEMDEERYRRVLDACALDHDMRVRDSLPCTSKGTHYRPFPPATSPTWVRPAKL